MILLNILIGILEFLVIIYMAYYFMSHIERTIYQKKRYYILAFSGFGAALLTATFIPSFVCGFIIIAAAAILTGHFLFNKKYTYIFFYFLMVAVLVLIQWTVLFNVNKMMSYLSMKDPLMVSDIVITLKMILEIGIIRLLTWFIQKKRVEKITVWQGLGMFLLPAVSIFFILSMVEVADVFMQLNGGTLISVNLILMLILNFYFLNLSVYVSKANELDQELKLYQQQSELQYQYYEELEKRYQDSRKVIHDMKNHLQAVERLYEEQEVQAGGSYVRDMYHMLNILGEKHYTDQKMLNIILNDKLKSAEREEIDCTVRIGELNLDFIKDIDVTTIFANLLDNAVRAARNNTDKSYIKVKIDCFNEFIVISIRNSFSGEAGLSEEKEGNRNKKEKHHGYGLQNVNNTLRKYGGTMQYTDIQNEFQVNIMIPKPAEA